MSNQTPTAYAYKNWFGFWAIKPIVRGTTLRPSTPVTLLYSKPFDYDMVCVSSLAWQKVANETMRHLKELRAEHEIVVAKLRTASMLLQEQDASIQYQIDALEKGQARAVREAALGIDGAVDRPKALDLKIRVLAGGFVR